MENKKYSFLQNVDIYSNTTSKENLAFQIYSGILFTISTIPNLISIIVIIFQKGKMKLHKYIQLMLCFSFLGIEIRFLPLKKDKINSDLYYYFQNGISYSCIIISTYYQLIYSVIAYKLFTSPDDLSKKYNIFFIYIFPIILFFLFGFFVNLNSHLLLYYEFLAYPEDANKNNIKHELSKKVSDLSRLIFFILNVIYSKKLLNEIKKILLTANKIDYNYAKIKYKTYKNKLILYFLAMIVVIHPYILRFVVESYCSNLDKGEALKNYTFSYYFHGIESFSGFLYWFIFIYNKFLLKRFLILFHCKKESEYFNEFIEEKKIYEESQNKFSSEISSTNNIPIINESFISENKTDAYTFSNEIKPSNNNTDNFKAEQLELNYMNKLSGSSYTSYDETL